jgi:hypothetical protein
MGNDFDNGSGSVEVARGFNKDPSITKAKAGNINSANATTSNLSLVYLRR